jgi:hypothetical protein
MYKILIHFIIIFIAYSLYVQLSPTMGNIWLRPDINGTQVFCPLGLIELIISPLYPDRFYFWTIHFWPINFFIYLIGYFFIYLLVVKGYNHSFSLTLNETVHEPQ